MSIVTIDRTPRGDFSKLWSSKLYRDIHCCRWSPGGKFIIAEFGSDGGELALTAYSDRSLEYLAEAVTRVIEDKRVTLIYTCWSVPGNERVAWEFITPDSPLSEKLYAHMSRMPKPGHPDPDEDLFA